MIGGEATSLTGLRRILLAILALGLAGTAADLLLIGHYEDLLQLVPLATIALSLTALVWSASPNAAGVRAFQAMMLVMIGSGAAGVILHYRGNMEFQLEMDASLRGLDLFAKVMRAKAPPALAPASMTWMGLLGLAATYRHPALTR